MPKSQSAPSTEIDAIFASKGKGKSIPSTSSTGKSNDSATAATTRKRKKQKDAPPDDSNERSEPVTSSTKDHKDVMRPAAEVILDPSLKIEAQLAASSVSAPPAKRAKRTKTSEPDSKLDGSYVQKKRVEMQDKDKDSDAKFMDSRGTGPRECFVQPPCPRTRRLTLWCSIF